MIHCILHGLIPMVQLLIALHQLLHKLFHLAQFLSQVSIRACTSLGGRGSRPPAITSKIRSPIAQIQKAYIL
jgi:hypothetical protein